ncbi:MAG TPA: TonB-dependent receptor [Sphingopyxis sp.]|nr:TonB-dependent receptor [Sphingopyxis sp.]
MASTAMTPAFAQQADDASHNDEEISRGRGGLEEIIVTARKREENLQNIPVAAQIVSSETLAERGIKSIENLSAMAPQLIVARTGAGSGASIALRGITPPNTSISVEQSVATVIDGIYLSGGSVLNEGLFDLAQVEVLKGPQSLFYGKNTTAGVISITTANPTRELEGMVRLGYEFRALNPSVEAFVSGPITDTLGFRLAGSFSKQYGGLFRNDTSEAIVSTYDSATGDVTDHVRPAGDKYMTGERSALVRGTLQWEPTNNLTARVKMTYTDYHDGSPAGNTKIFSCPVGGVPQNDPTTNCSRDFRVSQDPLPADIAATNPLFNRHGGKTYQDYRSLNIAGSIEYDADKFSLSLMPGFIRWKKDFMGDYDYTNGFPNEPDSLGSQIGNHTADRQRLTAASVEARLQTSLGGPINFMVGGYYQHQRIDFKEDVFFPNGPSNSAVTNPEWQYVTVAKLGRSTGETLAAFGQVLVDITSTLNFTAGARYTHETKDSTFRQPYSHPFYASTFPTGQIGAEQTFNNVSPEATLSWRVLPNITVYGSYRTGYKSGGYSISGLLAANTKASDAAFGPEKVKGFEGGIKSVLFDNQLRLNGDLFWYDYKGVQVDFFVADTLQYFTLNAAGMRTRGGELAAEFAPRALPGFTAAASIGYTDAQYRSFPFAPCIVAQSPTQGCLFGPTNDGTRNYQDLRGERPASAPEWTATANLGYESDIGNDRRLGLNISGRYSGSYKTYAFANRFAERFTQKSFIALDASLRLMAQDDSWEVALIGKNLTNRFIVTQAVDAPFTGSGTGTSNGIQSDVDGSISDPRTVSVQAVFRF